MAKQYKYKIRTQIQIYLRSIYKYLSKYLAKQCKYKIGTQIQMRKYTDIQLANRRILKNWYWVKTNICIYVLYIYIYILYIWDLKTLLFMFYNIWLTLDILINIIHSQHNIWSMWFMIYDLSQRPLTVSLGSLVVERTSGTQHTAYLPTIGGYST